LLRAPNADRDAVAARARRIAAQRLVARRELRRAANCSRRLPPCARARHWRRTCRAALRDGAPGRVATTLDASLQRLVTGVLSAQVAELHGRNVRDAAALVVDNASGDVLAYVGGSGALSSARFVDGVRAKRQAGSSLKPFPAARSIAARHRRDAPDDAVRRRHGARLYRPENYDRSLRSRRGARRSVTLNVPAVRLPRW
jgi:penicillin-binding protein 1C